MVACGQAPLQSELACPHLKMRHKRTPCPIYWPLYAIRGVGCGVSLLGLAPLPCQEKLLLVGGQSGHSLTSALSHAPPCLSSDSCVYKNVTCGLLKDLGEISSSEMQILQFGFSFAEIGLGHVLRLSYKFPL